MIYIFYNVESQQTVFIAPKSKFQLMTHALMSQISSTLVEREEYN